MGADISIASRSFSPRPPRFRWEGEDFVVQTDAFMDGYREYFRGPVTTSVERELLSKVIHCEVPPQPEGSKPVLVQMKDAPAYSRADLREAWADGWNGAVKRFGIEPETPVPEWKTWQTA